MLEFLEEKKRAEEFAAHLYRERGLDLLKNFCANLPLLEQALPVALFEGRFANIPALICGAAPSIEQEISSLREIGNRALVFSGGSGLNVLHFHQIFPHFAAAIDPNPPEERILEQSKGRVPFFFQLKTATNLLEQVRAKKIWVGWDHPLEDWAVEKLGLVKFSLDGGWNVVTFLVRLALLLGCNPIILVGIDLCFTKQVYGAGVIEKECRDMVSMKNQQGKTVWLKSDWQFAAKWLSDFALAHPGTSWINTSKSGLQIDGFKSRSFDEILPLFSKRWDLEKIIDGCEKPWQEKPIDTKELLCELEQSFNRVAKISSELLSIIEKFFPNRVDNKGSYILFELELMQEVAYLHFILPIWEVWKQNFYQEIPSNIQKWLFIKEVSEDGRKVCERAATRAVS
ncbi:MAG: DUF115 domain-containing protein [Chlamydiae bacterium]|nr:DUF115 domain-containing protein [Chlamydiota bacterium]